MKHSFLLPLLLATTGVAQTATWHELAHWRLSQAAAYDVARARLVMIETGAPTSLLEWDGTRVEPVLGGTPVVPTFQRLLYDDGAGQLVALGTIGGQIYVGRYGGNGWNWTTGGTAPVFDDSVHAAIDHPRGRVVMYHGGTSTIYEWDGQQWQLIATPAAPPTRAHGAFAFDPVQGRCVLFGGLGQTPLGDCWAWDGTTWTSIPTTGGPSPRGRAAMAFDTAGNRMILYGGTTDTTTWQLIGNSWSALPTVGDPGRQVGSIATASPQGLLLVTGGYTTANFAYDPTGTLWRLSGNQWTAIARFPNPTPRNNVSVAYDELREQFVTFGGTPTSTFPMPDLTLLFDTQWRHVAPATEPSRRHGASLVWSPPNQRVMLFGGADFNSALGDTWTWDGATWHSHATPVSPAPRYAPVLVRDPAGGILLFGGLDGTNYIHDQWRWDGVAWTQVQPAALPPARGAAMATYDPVANEVVMFGGHFTALIRNDTWTWDGTSWTNRSPATTPSAVQSMAFHPVLQRPVLCGLSGYEWSGTDWVSRPELGSTFASTQWYRVAADTVRGRLLSFVPPTVRLSTATRATVFGYGVSCATSGAPRLDSIGAPSLGTTSTLEVASQTPATLAFLHIGLGTQNVQYGNCTTHVANTIGVSIGMTDAGGAAGFPLTIPNVAALRGVQFVAQGAAYEPARSLIGSVTLTAALRILVGD